MVQCLRIWTSVAIFGRDTAIAAAIVMHHWALCVDRIKRHVDDIKVWSNKNQSAGPRWRL